jgi:hypothetical protein
VTGRYDLLAGVEGLGLSPPASPGERPGDERTSLVAGDRALLFVDDRERLWVEVARVSRDGDRVTYWGRLRSVPLVVKVRMTDGVRFEPRNVLKVERRGVRPAEGGSR